MAWSDAELVQRTLAGDREAFSKLVERHRRAVFAVALQRGFQPAEADDLAQEVFVKAYKGLGALQQPEAFARWLYGIAGHVAADAARARRRRREGVGLESAPEVEAPDDDLVHLELDRDSAEVLHALRELPEDQRLVLTLRYLENLTPKEIAERLGEPRGTIRSRLHHALGYLQVAFGLKVGAR
ncbi:MAG: sigma-70 family RNA polymerase sigma factor [Planctomycetota bacterium]|nr:sigma-70 family RNA polymerase sigma factor [Planctomycetota bacterium]